MFGENVFEHLIGVRRNDVERAGAHAYLRSRWRRGRVFVFVVLVARLHWKSAHALRHHFFDELDGVFVGRAANVAGAVIVVIRENAADFAVQIYALGPVDEIAHAGRRSALGEIVADAAGITFRVESGNHAASIRADPHTNVEWRADGRVFGGIRAADGCRRTPGQFLRRETLDSGGGENAWQVGGKAEAIGQHVFFAGLAEFVAKIFVAVKNLANDGFRRRRVDVVLLHRRACGKPLAGGNVMF